MDAAAENAPSCTKPQLYWFPFKAPVEGMLKDWASTMVESRAQSSQRVRLSSSPYPRRQLLDTLDLEDAEGQDQGKDAQDQ